MLVWSLSVTVAYADGSWSGSEYTYDAGSFITSGVDVSTLPEIKALFTRLGMTPKSGAPFRTDYTSIVFRFMAIHTNAYVNVLGSTEYLDILSNDEDAVVSALQGNDFFRQSFLTSSEPMWALTFSVDQETGSPVYPQSVTADSDGNSYSLSIVDEPNGVVIVRKISLAGEIVWQSFFFNPDANYDPSRIKFNNVNGYLYALYSGGIQKIDPETGAEVTSYWINPEIDQRLVSLGILSDGRLATLGDVNYETNHFTVAIWSEDVESGSIIKTNEWEIGINVGRNQYVNADLAIDYDDNIVIPLDYYDDEYGTLVIKWDPINGEPIWQCNVNGRYFDGNDQDGTGFAMDAAGNFYLNGYGRGITKINSEGVVQWARYQETDELYGLGVNSDGNAFIYGSNYSDDVLKILKFATDGSLSWAMQIASSNPLYGSEGGGWYDHANSMAQIINDQLYLVGSVQEDNEKELIIKLNGELITGTFGDFIFTEVTSDYSPINTTPVNDELSIYYGETNYLTQAPIGFESAVASQTNVKTDIG